MSRKKYVKIKLFWNPKKSPTKKISKHIACGYSMSTIWTFDKIGKNIVYIVESNVWKSFIFLWEKMEQI